MSACTIWGTAAVVGETSALYDDLGRLEEARTYDAITLDLPAAGLDLDISHDHDRVIGPVVHAELERDRVDVVAVVQDGDWLLDLDTPLYFSAELELRGAPDQLHGRIAHARTATLIGVALTTATARLGARPVQLHPGDVRSPLDRGRWPMNWLGEAPLLQRCADAVPRAGRASRILERRDTVTLAGGLVIDQRSGDPLGRVDRARLPVVRADERPAGPLEYRPCRIVTVR
jgi:hypothetical protein